MYLSAISIFGERLASLTTTSNPSIIRSAGKSAKALDIRSIVCSALSVLYICLRMPKSFAFFSSAYLYES